MLFQQGDVLIESCNEIPKDLPIKPDGIVAEGEATGHYHKVVGNAKVFGDFSNTLYMDVLSDSEVVHQEHNTIQIPAGKYKIRQVREYDHFAEEARRVAD